MKILNYVVRSDSGNPARENDFDYRKNALQVAPLPISAYEITNAGNIFRNTFIEQLYTQMKLSLETLVQEVQSVVFEFCWNLKKSHMHKQVFGFLSQPRSR